MRETETSSETNITVVQDSSQQEYNISVLVPIYNSENTLEQALDSVLAQDARELEIVVVDDCCTDSSSRIISEYASLHKNITAIKHIKNSGYGASMNDGIRFAKGKWIAIVEPDDYIAPGMYSTMLNVAIKYAQEIECNADVIKTPYLREIRRDGMIRGEEYSRILQCSYRHRINPLSQPFNMTDKNASHLLRHHPSIWSAIYRKDFLGSNNIKFVEYPGSGWADNEFFYETMLRAENIVYVDTPFYVYREETQKEFEEFTRRDPFLALDRWDSMMDIVDQLGITNEYILRSHISKGFTYLSGVLDTCGKNYAVLNRAYDMFSRMPRDLVLREKKLNTKLKDMYKTMMSATWNSKHEHTAHKVELIREAKYQCRNNGIAFTISQIINYLSKN